MRTPPASERHVFTDDGYEPDPPPLTGERTAPGIAEENYWFQRHVAAYQFAAVRARGRVLDAGAGEGYGGEMLADAGASVVAVDLDRPTVRRAAGRYPRVTFAEADLTALPVRDASLDAVVSLQVIEHLPRPGAFLAECARVLAPGGTLILSTPNRLTFSPDGIRNPFHTVEFAPDELAGLLLRHFPHVRMLGTSHGPRLRLLEAILRRAFPERLLAQPASEWPPWLRRAVAAVRAADFRVHPRALARSLDLVALARR